MSPPLIHKKTLGLPLYHGNRQQKWNLPLDSAGDPSRRWTDSERRPAKPRGASPKWLSSPAADHFLPNCSSFPFPPSPPLQGPLSSDLVRGEVMMEGDSFSGLGNGTQVDSKVLQTFQKSFLQVQRILDQNRLLINEINQNHESKIPDNLSRNVGLIRELNNNIRRVVDLYADLSLSFTRSMETSSEGDSEGKPGNKRNRPG
ncbi:hypothetical protein B296_00001973 [Ensete ventricosum]|uniref:Protein EARLY FLOWERING 4 domain-containing protein n=1 Tax=Ensete ventricosum TaxID=4639 RepID=A0A427A988_ENSVE|nr:hypothetical protein B296_00001973 [Ensete ventricosum]